MSQTPIASNGATASTPTGPTPPMSQQAQDLLGDKAFMEALEQKLTPKIVDYLHTHPQDLLGDKAFMEALEQKLTQDLLNNKTFTEALAPKLRPKVVEYLHTHWVRLSLALAIVSLMIMIGVYGLSLWLGGGAKAIETFAVPMIGAFCFVILVINVAFNMTVFRVTR